MYIFNIFVLAYLFIGTKAKLYNENDNVTIFNKISFESTFNDIPKYSWFIQYYNPYCGHCVNFAPLFKSFLQEAKYWNWIINFGVVDCDAERILCSGQGVQYYPFFKIYPGELDRRVHNLSGNGHEVKLPHDTIDDVYSSAIAVIETNLSPAMLQPQKNLSNSMETPYLFLTGGNLRDLKRTVLTYYNRLKHKLYYQNIENVKDFKLRFVTHDSTGSEKFPDLPHLYKGLNNYLKKNDEIHGKQTIRKITTSSPIIKRNQFSTIYPVYNQDMFASILYAFTNDVSDEKLVTEENVNILKNFFIQLYQFSGFEENLLAKFSQIIKQLSEKSKNLNARSKFFKSWASIMKSAQLPSVDHQWIGCNGSMPHLRRYPCGMWTTFHIMSINQYIKSETNQAISNESLNFIRAIRDFIFTFFSCKECADNFKRETADYETEVTNTKKAVLYLWRVHNSVNKRLTGKPSEDPQFPKIAFPSKLICPRCRVSPDIDWPTRTQWRENNVFDYLIQHYSNINVVHFQTRPSLLVNNSTWLSINLSSVEISICVILSIFSSFIVLVAFLKFLRDSFILRKRKVRKSVV